MKPHLILACALMAISARAEEAISAVQPLSNAALPGGPGAPAPVTLWKLIESGGWAMIPLGIMSVITVTLVLVFLFSLRRSAVVTVHFMNTADVLLKKRDYAGLLAISSRHGESIARVAQRTLDFLTRNPSADFQIVREIAETEGATQAASLQHRITYLADIAMLAPMVGLLGTVGGIIKSFGMLASRGAQDRNLLLAGGVSEALVATATGLVLGILSMAFYAIFRGRVQSLISDLEIASSHLVAMLAVGLGKKKPEPASRSQFTSDDDF